MIVKQTVYFEVHVFKYEKYRSVHKKVVKNLKNCNLLYKMLKLPSDAFLNFNWILILPLEREVNTISISRDAVHDIINNYHDDIHHMYHGLNHYSQQEYMTHDNHTHGYR